MDAKNYTISQETHNFIECLISMQNLYSQVGSAVVARYGDNISTVDSIINERFWEQYDALWRAIQDLMLMSINENIGNLNTTEI